VDLPSNKTLARPVNESVLSSAPKMFPGAGVTTTAPAPSGLSDAALGVVGHESTGEPSPLLDVAAAVAQGVLARAPDHQDGIGQVNVTLRFSVDSASIAQ
jgi:hypothetical protein